LRKKELLRAWDAADEYLLDTINFNSLPHGRLLIVNDAFGALGLALHQLQPISWSDSWLAHQATRENLLANGLDIDSVELLASTAIIDQPVSALLIKIPKNLALLQYQLQTIKPLLTEHSIVMLAGMIKAMPSSVWKIVETVIGPTQTSLARKKSRIIHAAVDPVLSLGKQKYPITWPLEHSDLVLINHVNVFSRDRLDIGSRLMLKCLPQSSGAVDIIDLGCGNGVLGLVAARQNPVANLHFVDESYMAIDSARSNMQQLDRREGTAQFHTTDGLHSFVGNSADIILCNPPFHQQQARLDTVALSMFRQAARVLRGDGALYVVGNRHLGYHVKLKRWFRQVELIGSDRKFVVLCARNRKLN